MRFDSLLLKQFTADIFSHLGCLEDEARLIAERLVRANLMGHDSHGVARVPRYIVWAKEGSLIPNQTVQWVLESGPFAIADARRGFGQVAGEIAINRACELVEQHGISLVGLRDSGHLGRIGEWAEMAAERGFASLLFVNVVNSHLVAPHNGLAARMSTNPLTVGIPLADQPPLILDMTSCIAAEGKFMVARNRGTKLPAGWLLDPDGNESYDAEDLYRGGAIMPLAGHKGHGLALIIDLLAGAMIGARSGGLPSGTKGIANNMCCILFDPLRVGGTADEIVSEANRLLDWVRDTPTLAGADILMPGEIERQRQQERLRDGVPIDDGSWRLLCEAAASIGVTQVPAPL